MGSSHYLGVCYNLSTRMLWSLVLEMSVVSPLPSLYFTWEAGARDEAGALGLPPTLHCQCWDLDPMGLLGPHTKLHYFSPSTEFCPPR